MDPATLPGNHRPLLYVAALAAAMHDVRRQVREERQNDGREVRHILKNAGIDTPAPWCAAWVQDVTDTAAEALGVRNPLNEVKLEALVASYAAWATKQKKERVVVIPSKAVPGDLVLFNFGGARWDHMGIVTAPPSDDARGAVFWTHEGNTGNGRGQPEGVYAKMRRVIPGAVMFVRWA